MRFNRLARLPACTFGYNVGMKNERTFITSPGNPLIKKARALNKRKVRFETGLFLVEGIHLVGEIIEAQWQVDTLIYAPDQLTSSFARNLVVQQTESGMQCQPVSAEVFSLIAEKENPQGILAIVRQRTRTLEHLTSNSFSWGVALLSPQDPGNVGAILRTIDAVAADGLILLETGVDPYHPSAVRASMGALFWKPVVAASFSEFIEWVHRGGYRLVGSSAHAQADYRVLRQESGRLVLLLGSEQKGLTREQMGACDLIVGIPMLGRTTSLNLAVSAGILLSALKEGRSTIDESE